MKPKNERKFIIQKIPNDVVFTKEILISQNYISAKESSELRIKRESIESGVVHKLIYKSEEGITQSEQEIEIPSYMYFDLTDSTIKKSLQKKRKCCEVNGLNVTVDVYLYDLNLIVAKVVFETKEMARNFEIPNWFGEEITDNSTYKSRNIWKSIQKN